VIHRDIKPSNLMVDTRGHLFVTDFGLARLPQQNPGLTRTGDLVGTLRYMCPEQARGDQNTASPAMDIYALGLTLYELSTLRPAFRGADRQQLLRRILHEEPPTPRRLDPSIPRDLETIILKAIAKEPQARYASAGELADDLRRFLDDQPIRARRPNLGERASRWVRRHRSVVLTASSVLMLALSVSTVLLWQAKRNTDAALASLNEAKGNVETVLQSKSQALRERTQALTEQRIASELAITTINQITERLTNGRGKSSPLRGAVPDQVYQVAIAYYDELAGLPGRAKLVSEVTAKAYRRAGFLRMVLGDPQGRENYELATRSYQDLLTQSPGFLWLHTGLIETLLEYSHCLSVSGDKAKAEAMFNQALHNAEELLANKDVAYPCYHAAMIDPFNRLAWNLLARPRLDHAELALAIRLARLAAEWKANLSAPAGNHYQLAVIETPGMPDPWTTLGFAYCRAGDWNNAGVAFRTSIDLVVSRFTRDLEAVLPENPVAAR
jgi:tetratricopeptide (TPR) repeat protein